MGAPAIAQPEDDKAVLVAMEAGAPWPRWLGRKLTRAPNVFCAVQQNGDERDDLWHHVDHLAARLARSPYSVELAVLLFGPAERASATRLRIAVALGLALSSETASELVLVGARRRRVEDSLIRVAQLVSERLRNPCITVRTLFLTSTHFHHQRLPALARAGAGR